MTRFWTGPESRPDRYVVEDEQGRPRHEPGGGVEGLVYRATVNDPGAPDHGDEVALKVLLTSRPVELDEVRRRLAPLMEPLDPRLMRVRDAFVGAALSDAVAPDPDDFDVVYVVADWVEGIGLDTEVGGLDRSLAFGVIAELAEAVAMLHAVVGPAIPTGILHRDIKTSNVRVRPDGTPVLVDYGLARPDSADASVVGTPGWLAPEVASGIPGGKAADVYGVGAVAFDLLTGEPPRRDGAPAAAAKLRAALAGTPLATDIASHIASTLELSPEARPDDLSTWASQLRQLVAGKRLRRPVSARRLAAIGAATAAIVVAAIAAGASVGDSTPRDEEATTEPAQASGGSGNAAEPRIETASEPTRPACNTEPVVPESAPGAAVLALFESMEGACAGAVEPYGEGVTMSLVGENGEVSGFLIASPTTPALELSPSDFASYQEVVGRDRVTENTLFAGYPASITADERGDYSIIEMSLSGVIVTPQKDAQGFWIPEQVLGIWEESGGLHGSLGAPTSPVFSDGVSLRLEFERGYMEAPLDQGLTARSVWLTIRPEHVTVHYVDPAAELAALGEVEGRVLRQANGTAWYVSDGRRRWIPDGETWGCVQAEDRLAPGDVPGYALSAIPLGDRARC